MNEPGNLGRTAQGAFLIGHGDRFRRCGPGLFEVTDNEVSDAYPREPRVSSSREGEDT